MPSLRASLVLATSLMLLAPVPGVCETLRQALSANRIDAGGLPAQELDQNITSYAVLNDPKMFLIAYYLDDGSGRLGNRVYVDLFEKSGHGWTRRNLDRDSLLCEKPAITPGSILRIARSRDYFLLDTHINPSAGCLVVLTRDLTYYDGIYGWLLAAFGDGLLVYQNSQVHFAPTHYTEVSVYDPRAKKHWLVYPRKPYQAVRLEHIEKVRAEYKRRGEKWFMENNHHGDPELFDNGMGGNVATNDRDHSLIFQIAYDNTDTWGYSEKVKFQEFGGLSDSLKAYQATEPLPEGLFVVLGQMLLNIRSSNHQEDLLRVFKDDPEISELLRAAFANPGEYGRTDWRKHFDALDARWEGPGVWQGLQKALKTPPPVTQVVCILRHIDREKDVQYREMLMSDFERKFGKRPWREYLEPALLNEIFAQ
jgi:hypothetical protein